MPKPPTPRQFALETVRALRAAGFEAYWAGGCVRDQLLGRVPKDYDVASSAEPDQIRQLFGKRRTLPLGVAFGVITLLGPKGAGQIEIATFRKDADYSDGRHPDHVTFSSAREDASRRDFTINGLFFDPLEEKVIDFVGGQEDLAACVIRAIGNPRERIDEDKLRMLRAVRFTATLGFRLEDRTLDAVREMANGIGVVSQERITAELRRTLIDRNRVQGVRLLLETGLADQVFPEIVPVDAAAAEQLQWSLDVIDRFEEPGISLVLAGLLVSRMDRAGVEEVCLHWRLANKETDRAGWLVENAQVPAEARSLPWSRLQRILIQDGIDDLLILSEAMCRASGKDIEPIDWCRTRIAMPRAQLDPEPLLTGTDLMKHGVRRGPIFRVLLDGVRDAQLDKTIHSTTEALLLVDKILAEQQEREQ